MSRRSRAGIRPRPQLFGKVAHTPGWLHRTAPGVKLGVIALIGVVALIFRDPIINWSMFAVLVVLGFSARLKLHHFLKTWLYAGVLILIVVVMQYFFGSLQAGLTVGGTVFACVQAALLLTLTTTVAQLLDTFTVIVSPLRYLRASPDTIALTASLMVRAISHISGLLGEADRAARARGLDSSIKARVVPAILRSVKYAQDTGRALDARGIVD
ncbi:MULTISPECIES: energy-coupling factor transporter transmembrane component T family protein [unclassified Brevibacterium]|uniref:energy-coupling factor transporter transmembrane component T family protein n=1 Tax=unclassified Brevibacterium TaxID=2614124 RepID=UPI000C58DF0A|nr:MULTISPECIES: CbiQ family ECF transporter T component [unclassified Brevibacterium]SMX99138.1 biotin transport system permease protein [Brevibacterium sp. 239c]